MAALPAHGVGLSRCRYVLPLLLTAFAMMLGCQPSGTEESAEPAKTAPAEGEAEVERAAQPAEEQAPEEKAVAESKQAAQEQTKEEVEQVAQEEEKPLEWDRPRFTERKEEREYLVDTQLAAPGHDVKDERVLEAMRQVPRHLFVPRDLQRAAYMDTALPIDYGQTISQPYVVALMTELLEVEPGDSVLEIGTGSGYQAAVLTELTPYVYTIEIIEELGQSAEDRLEKLGYKTVKVKVADGYFGWEEHAPFDGIIVTCAAGHIPPPLLKQLKAGGRMVIPVGGPFENQFLVLVSKDEEGNIRSKRVLPVRFVPMTGRAQEGP